MKAFYLIKSHNWKTNALSLKAPDFLFASCEREKAYHQFLIQTALLIGRLRQALQAAAWLPGRIVLIHPIKVSGAQSSVLEARWALWWIPHRPQLPGHCWSSEVHLIRTHQFFANQWIGPNYTQRIFREFHIQQVSLSPRRENIRDERPQVIPTMLVRCPNRARKMWTSSVDPSDAFPPNQLSLKFSC